MDVVPPGEFLRCDMRSEAAVFKSDLGIRAPWSCQIDRTIRAAVSGEITMDKMKSVTVRRCAGSTDKALYRDTCTGKTERMAAALFSECLLQQTLISFASTGRGFFYNRRKRRTIE